MSPVLEAGYLRSADGMLFYVKRRAPEPAHGCVLVIPPFAEEMNKSRRMIALVARSLANRGFTTILPDLVGTGDSLGDFATATGESWEENLADVCDWCEASGHRVSAILAIRLGAAIALRAVDKGRMPSLKTTVLWQPVFDGRRYLTQFLRLRVAAGLTGESKESTNDLHARLAKGETIEVAGYEVSSRLAAYVQALTVPATLPQRLGAVTWFDVVRQDGAVQPLWASALCEAARADGRCVHYESVVGEQYWNTVAISTLPELIDRTVEAFLEDRPGA